MERWRAVAQETGELSALVELSKQVRNDLVAIVARHDAREAELNARADAISARERKVAVDAAVVSELMGRVGKAIDRLEQKKADQERQPEEPLNILPRKLSKEPEPSAALEDATPGDPSEDPAEGEAPLRLPVAAGFDNAKE